MKKLIIIISAFLIIGGIAFINLKNGHTKSAKSNNILNVKDIQSDPSAYKGVVIINGVVARVFAKDRVFLIVDTAEVRLCKTVECGQFYLPVEYNGVLPKVLDEVNITGSFKEGGRVFVADKIDIVGQIRF
jgi:cytochrome c-type biogenesis protein CcmE